MRFVVPSRVLSRTSSKSIQIRTEGGRWFKEISSEGDGLEIDKDKVCSDKSVDVWSWSLGREFKRPPAPVPTGSAAGYADAGPPHRVKAWLDGIGAECVSHDVPNPWYADMWPRIRRLAARHVATEWDGVAVVPPTYDFLRTKTGRPTVSGQHNPLTMPVEDRKKYRSRHPGGSVVYIDMSGFETRLLAARVGLDLGPGDPYVSLGELTRMSAPRDAIKTAVLGTLFGMGAAELTSRIGCTPGEALAIAAKLRDVFRTPELCGGSVVTPAGRRIPVPEPRLGPSYWAQGTGVDVAWRVFDGLVESSGGAVEPIAVVHDALIADVAPGYPAVEAAERTTEFAGLGATFPSKCEVLSTRAR